MADDPQDNPVAALVEAGKPSDKVRRRIERRLRVMAERVAQSRVIETHPMTRERRRVFLDCLTYGFTVRDACLAAGIAPRTAYWERRRDDRFAQDWDDALDAGLADVEEAMRQLATSRTQQPMARVQAARLLSEGASHRYRKGGPVRASAKLSQDADGGGRLEVAVTRLGVD